MRSLQKKIKKTIHRLEEVHGSALKLTTFRSNGIEEVTEKECPGRQKDTLNELQTMKKVF